MSHVCCFCSAASEVHVISALGRFTCFDQLCDCRKSSITVPSATTYAKAGLGQIGYETVCTPYWVLAACYCSPLVAGAFLPYAMSIEPIDCIGPGPCPHVDSAQQRPCVLCECPSPKHVPQHTQESLQEDGVCRKEGVNAPQGHGHSCSQPYLGASCLPPTRQAARAKSIRFVSLLGRCSFASYPRP